jgi:hypothetical protein
VRPCGRNRCGHHGAATMALTLGSAYRLDRSCPPRTPGFPLSCGPAWTSGCSGPVWSRTRSPDQAMVARSNRSDDRRHGRLVDSTDLIAPDGTRCARPTGQQLEPPSRASWWTRRRRQPWMAWPGPGGGCPTSPVRSRPGGGPDAGRAVHGRPRYLPAALLEGLPARHAARVTPVLMKGALLAASPGRLQIPPQERRRHILSYHQYGVWW